MPYSLSKAAGVLGIGAANLIKMPAGPDGRINLHALEKAVAECRSRDLKIIAIVGIAGTTDTGAIDPLPQMADIARRGRIHFHVDAAWGGPFLFSNEHQHKLAGIQRAD